MNGLNQNAAYIAGFSRGDLQAVSHIFREYFSRLVSSAENLVSDQEAAHEIVTETFIKLLRRRNHLHNEADIKAFLYITTRNACMDYLKQQRDGIGAEKTLLSFHETQEDICNENFIKKANEVLFAVIEHLPVIEQQVFRALFVEGMPLSEAARVLNFEQRDLLFYRKNILRQLQTALLAKNVYSTPFFVHFLTVTASASLASEALMANNITI